MREKRHADRQDTDRGRTQDTERQAQTHRQTQAQWLLGSTAKVEDRRSLHQGPANYSRTSPRTHSPRQTTETGNKQHRQRDTEEEGQRKGKGKGKGKF